MNQKQLCILKALFKEGKEGRELSTGQYKPFVEDMLRELRVAEDEPFWEGFLHAEAVIEYFMAVASKLDLSECFNS